MDSYLQDVLDAIEVGLEPPPPPVARAWECNGCGEMTDELAEHSRTYHQDDGPVEFAGPFNVYPDGGPNILPEPI